MNNDGMVTGCVIVVIAFVILIALAMHTGGPINGGSCVLPQC